MYGSPNLKSKFIQRCEEVFMSRKNIQMAGCAAPSAEKVERPDNDGISGQADLPENVKNADTDSGPDYPFVTSGNFKESSGGFGLALGILSTVDQGKDIHASREGDCLSLCIGDERIEVSVSGLTDFVTEHGGDVMNDLWNAGGGDVESD